MGKILKKIRENSIKTKLKKNSIKNKKNNEKNLKVKK